MVRFELDPVDELEGEVPFAGDGVDGDSLTTVASPLVGVMKESLVKKSLRVQLDNRLRAIDRAPANPVVLSSINNIQ